MDIKKSLSILDGIHEGTKFSFAGEPKQKAGDQVRGTDKAKAKKSGEHPFANKLVGAAESILRDLNKQVDEGSVERRLKQEFAKFDEGYDHNFHAKPFSRRGPDVTGEEDPQGDFRVVKQQGGQWVDMKQHSNSNDAFRHAGAIKSKYPNMTIGVKWPNGTVNPVGDAYLPQSNADASKSMYFFNLRNIAGSFTDQQLQQLGLRQSQNGSWFYKPQAGASEDIIAKTVASLEQKLGATAKKWMPPVRESKKQFSDLELAVMEGGHELTELGNTPAGKAAVGAVQKRAHDKMDAWSRDPKSGYSSTPPSVSKATASAVRAGNRLNGVAEETGDEKFDAMMGNITSPEALDSREAVALMQDLIHNAGASYKEALLQASVSFEIEPAELHALYQEQSKSIDEDDEDLPPPQNAQRTQIPGTLPTYKKARAHLDTHSPTGKTIDIGSGLGLGAAELGADSYEPYPKKDVKPTYTDFTAIPDNAYHRVTNFNVLNVVPPKLRQEIVQNIGRILAPGGVALITTRGKDVMTALKNGKPGPEPMSVITSAGTYQKGFTTKELIGYVEQVLGGSYDVLPLQKMGQAGVIIRKHPEGKTPRKIKEYGMTTGGTANPTAQQPGQLQQPDPQAAQAQKANLNKIAGADKNINVAQATHAIQGIATNPGKPMASTDVKQTKALTDLVGDALADPQKGGQVANILQQVSKQQGMK
jgi:hypothetical protein